MGRREGKFVRLSLCEESGTSDSGIELGYLSCLTVQFASDICCGALCDAVCADRDSHGKYV